MPLSLSVDRAPVTPVPHTSGWVSQKRWAWSTGGSRLQAGRADSAAHRQQHGHPHDRQRRRRRKHMNIRCHFTRDMVKTKEICTKRIATEQQLADTCTSTAATGNHRASQPRFACDQTGPLSPIFNSAVATSTQLSSKRRVINE